MDGFQRQPFHVREKETDRMPQELVSNYVVKPKEVTEKIKEEIKQMRADKEVSKRSASSLSIATEQKSTTFETKAKNTQQVTTEKEMMSLVEASPVKKEVRKKLKATRMKKEKIGESEKPKMFTLLELGKASYSELGLPKGKKGTADIAKLLQIDLSGGNDKDDPESDRILQKFKSPRTGNAGPSTGQMKSMYS